MKHGHRKGRFTKPTIPVWVSWGRRRERRGGKSASPKAGPLGVLTWHTADGSVSRSVIEQGPRANNIAVVARAAEAVGGAETRVEPINFNCHNSRKELRTPQWTICTCENAKA